MVLNNKITCQRIREYRWCVISCLRELDSKFLDLCFSKDEFLELAWARESNVGKVQCSNETSNHPMTQCLEEEVWRRDLIEDFALEELALLELNLDVWMEKEWGWIR